MPRHDPEVLRQLSLSEMTRGQRIAATKLGIMPGIRSERERQLRARYGLTLEAYADLLAQGNGCCWVCKQPWHRDLYVDHSHQTQEVRGLLCAECNTLVGAIERSLERAMNVYMYLFPILAQACQDEMGDRATIKGKSW